MARIPPAPAADAAAGAPLTTNRLARIGPHCADARAVQQRAAERLAALGVRVGPAAALPDDASARDDYAQGDYAQIDPALARTESAPQGAAPQSAAPPAPGVGYAGLTPGQRSRFLRWLDNTHADAPPAFQQLYLAHLETGLLDALADGTPDDTPGGAPGPVAGPIVAELRRLEPWPHWRNNEQRSRSLLLALRLQQDGRAIADWIATGAPHLRHVGLALGQQALLGTPLTPAELLALGRWWKLVDAPPPMPVITLRLSSLAHSLGADPLAHALARTGEAATQPQPWRCAHRDLRLALPQPDLRPALEPLLADLLGDVAGSALFEPMQPAATASAQDSGEDDAAEDDAPGRPDWSLVLEFGQSRSDYFDFALEQAQRLPGYVVLMDEQRRMVHRVHFRKGEMRRFWRLWDYVQGWTDTHVYVNGVELEKWKIWPYSHYLR